MLYAAGADDAQQLGQLIAGVPCSCGTPAPAQSAGSAASGWAACPAGPAAEGVHLPQSSPSGALEENHGSRLILGMLR